MAYNIGFDDFQNKEFNVFNFLFKKLAIPISYCLNNFIRIAVVFKHLLKIPLVQIRPHLVRLKAFILKSIFRKLIYLNVTFHAHTIKKMFRAKINCNIHMLQ